ncbi:folate-binding protein YgfZ [Phyllobacterium sp. YR531]|uniref:CAF17-like 4Fe-4S cluster assembly/insertion protein YgfZ n=1 Tax=Phyllobacterium sp. YR531 TaxID=1144343 RepID=UPI00026F6D32|nr:folate-binding protein YgfZ [Phyllobacterium sp. YR531]EJM98822.1 folate-binding protein YgfZ [Phyllobacterium sp. YR531]
MPSALLNGRAILSVTGEDAESFLQNLITTDLDNLKTGKLRPGALLSPQGKVMFEFLISRSPVGLRLDTLQSAAEDFAKRLSLYKLRAKVQISVDLESLVVVSWESESDISDYDSTVRDERFPETANVYRHYSGTIAKENNDAWTRLRIVYGVAEAPADFALGDAFPHDINFDQTGGVSFKKGCFIGQEVVSRMQHRGTARRRILIVDSLADLPPTGTAIAANGRELGILGSIAGRCGLALVRIDRVKDAMDSGTPILAGDIAIDLAIPPEHRFTFPVTAQEA